ncbi:penicillin-binding protein activator [Novosphingobium sp.]|uniref:penicillin-binding protein activator n=1 Tax=Novosphingobium sp. TaxID=1874826 RepID=UPI0022BE17E5|nr:penicillin-binding protein activator [Novosphingobium sp.]MCZ8017304.1 penicillin-binding protein activator [Novosphingobium sp.]MCZ8034173.1 penicillin-binding protein activator [Novosphingobium sp.]MCZ8051528.1 penicillin-binding protein activator [Novosphingobium sp.]MCZ8059874.1 penicillin-binding protein activator [Novosphingobium sp.]MCZ8231712.1 penicillin-binding protein activator [Novosphingobium sp.]
MSINRRKLIALGAVVLLAGCKVIPKGAPDVTPVPDDRPTDALPADQQRHRVALLVPMSGPNAAVGESIANATTMALLDTNAKNLRITTYDTSTGPAAAATKAIAEGNKLILGPLQADEVAAVATVARASRVPLIAYASDSGVAARDVFVMGTAPGNSLGRTVSFAGKQGVRRFALLAPNGDYGARAKLAFGEAVTRAGGSLVVTEAYERSNTSIISAARRLKARGGFDAVLIADGARSAALAAPQIKAAGAPSPRILGPELWSGEQVVGTTPALRGAWFSAIADTRFKTFADSYQSRFGARPYRVATQGYDSVLLAIRIARDWRPGTPFPTARLIDPDGFLGLDGPFRFAPNGVIERALEVREARTGGVAVVSPAPDKFGD